MLHPLHRLAFLIVTNGGGEGKTFITLLLQALMELLGYRPLTIDTDLGNRAASSTGSELVKFINPLVPKDGAIEKIFEILGDHRPLLIDAGANILAATDFSRNLNVLGTRLQNEGFKPHALWIASTNKLGSADNSRTLAPRLNPPFPPLMTFCDRDGSGRRPEGWEKPDVFVDYLWPGLVHHVNAAGGFTRIVSDGLPGYEHSAAYIVKYFLRFAAQPAIRELFGADRIDQLIRDKWRDTLDISPATLLGPMPDNKVEKLARQAEMFRLVRSHSEDPEMLAAIREVVARRRT